jgi:hypothetical protein
MYIEEAVREVKSARLACGSLSWQELVGETSHTHQTASERALAPLHSADCNTSLQ